MMGTMLFILGVGFFILFIHYRWGDYGRDEAVNEVEDAVVEEKKPMTYHTRTLVLRVLKSIGCQPEETEEGPIKFEYQGVIFMIEAQEDCPFVNLIWPWCHSCSFYDVDEFSRVRRMVNEVNMHYSCKLFYLVNSEADEVGIHVKKHFLFIPQIPQLDGYLIGYLSSFFETVRSFDVDVEKIRLQECEK